MKLIRECLLELAQQPMGVNRMEAAKVLGIADITASGYLSALCRDGQLGKVGGGKATRYCMPDRVVAVGKLIPDYELEQSLRIKRVIRPAVTGQYVPCKGHVRSVFELAA